MFERVFHREFTAAATPQQAWQRLTDRETLGAMSSHPVLVARTPGLTAGDRWQEIHDDACDFDTVPWQCIAADPPRSFTIVGLQSGIRQRVRTRLEPHPTGVLVVTELGFRPSFRAHATPIERLLVVPLLLLPFGVRILDQAIDEAVEDDARALEDLVA